MTGARNSAAANSAAQNRAGDEDEIAALTEAAAADDWQPIPAPLVKRLTDHYFKDCWCKRCKGKGAVKDKR